MCPVHIDGYHSEICIHGTVVSLKDIYYFLRKMFQFFSIAVGNL